MLLRARVLVVGDFNSQGKTGVAEYLTAGVVTPSFRESGDDTERKQDETCLTSKVVRRGICDTFQDVYDEKCLPTFLKEEQQEDEMLRLPPPPTLVVADIMSRMIDEESGKPTAAMLCALETMYFHLCVDNGEKMTIDDVDKWLIRINRVLGRGSEFRCAMRILEEKKNMVKEEKEMESQQMDICFELKDLVCVYSEELNSGKYWGVEHDVTLINGRGIAAEMVHVMMKEEEEEEEENLLQHRPPFCARFDYVWCSTMTMECLGVKKLMTKEHHDAVHVRYIDVLPNAWHPSDHLPVSACFRFL